MLLTQKLLWRAVSTFARIGLELDRIQEKPSFKMVSPIFVQAILNVDLLSIIVDPLPR